MYRFRQIGILLGFFAVISLPGMQRNANACEGDVSGDGVVNANDLLQIINSWGPFAGNASDINCDGVVNIFDLLTVINSWGVCNVGDWNSLIQQTTTHPVSGQCIVSGQVVSLGTVTSVSLAVEQIVEGAAFLNYGESCEAHRIADIKDPIIQAQAYADYSALVEQYVFVGAQLVQITWTTVDTNQFTTIGVESTQYGKFEPIMDLIVTPVSICPKPDPGLTTGGATQGFDTDNWRNIIGRLKATAGLRVRAASTSPNRCNSTANPLFTAEFICNAAFPFRCPVVHANPPANMYCKTKSGCTCLINPNFPQPNKMDCADASYNYSIEIIATSWFGGISAANSFLAAWTCADGTGGAGNPGP